MAIKVFTDELVHPRSDVEHFDEFHFHYVDESTDEKNFIIAKQYSPLGDTPYLVVSSKVFKDKNMVNALNLYSSLQVIEEK